MRRMRLSLMAMAVVVSATAVMPREVGAVTNVPVGTGPMVMTVSTTSVGLPLLTHGAGPTCVTMALTGTWVAAVVGIDAKSSYAGPITLTGTYQACGVAYLDDGMVSFVLDGNPLFGDFHCGTPAAPATGVLIRIGAEVEMNAGAPCVINGIPQYTPGTADGFVFIGVAAPTSVDTSVAVDAYTVSGEASLVL